MRHKDARKENKMKEEDRILKLKKIEERKIEMKNLKEQMKRFKQLKQNSVVQEYLNLQKDRLYKIKRGIYLCKVKIKKY